MSNVALCIIVILLLMVLFPQPIILCAGIIIGGITIYNSSLSSKLGGVCSHRDFETIYNRVENVHKGFGTESAIREMFNCYTQGDFTERKGMNYHGHGVPMTESETKLYWLYKFNNRAQKNIYLDLDGYDSYIVDTLQYETAFEYNGIGHYRPFYKKDSSPEEKYEADISFNKTVYNDQIKRDCIRKYIDGYTEYDQNNKLIIHEPHPNFKFIKLHYGIDSRDLTDYIKSRLSEIGRLHSDYANTFLFKKIIYEPIPININRITERTIQTRKRKNIEDRSNSPTWRRKLN